MSRIFEVATFYKAFSLNPRGRHQLSLCLGTACHVRGAPLIQDSLERTLGIKAGETTKDLEYTFETVNCLGACALGPILVVDNEYQGQVTLSKTNKILRQLGKKVVTDEEED
jgi:NADH-quinone oxidoreductase subunit E